MESCVKWSGPSEKVNYFQIIILSGSVVRKLSWKYKVFWEEKVYKMPRIGYKTLFFLYSKEYLWLLAVRILSFYNCLALLSCWLDLQRLPAKGVVMVDPLKIFWVLTNSTYLGKYFHISLFFRIFGSLGLRMILFYFMNF